MSAIESFIAIVKDVSPILGSIVSSSDPLAGFIISIIAKTFGANKDNMDDIVDKMTLDPEYKLKLKIIEYNHMDDITKSSIQNDENARDREIKFIQATGKKDVMMHLIAFIIIAGFFSICFSFIFFDLDKNQSNILNIMLGTMIAAFGHVIKYYF